MTGPASDAADVVVVGGGHNGLVCAAYLAKAGVDVCVVEQNEELGGALFSSTTSSGVTLEHGGVDHSTIVGSTIPDELDLARHGLRYLDRTASAMHLFGDGTRIPIAASVDETVAAIGEIDTADAAAWAELADLSIRLMELNSEIARGRPVPASVALAAARVALGRGGRPLIDLATSSVAELAERRFRSPHLRAVAILRSTFSSLPAWYPGTAAVFALTLAGHGRRYARPEGGSRAFVASLAAAAATAGASIRTGAAATAIRRSADGWSVELGGRPGVLARRAVVSALPPQDTVLRLLGDGDVVPPGLRRRFEDVEVASGNLSQFTLAAALAARPDLGPVDGTGYESSMLWLLDEPRDAMAAHTAALAGCLPPAPGVVMTLLSEADPTLAPAGRASLWVNGHLARELAEPHGWAAAAPDAIERIWATIDSCLPRVRPLVVEQRLTTPADLTARTGAINPGGHVSPTLDQLMGGRPVRGCADHRLGVDGIYLTGAGTNPGPSISGMPGRECAMAVLDDLAGRSALDRLGTGVHAAGRELARLWSLGGAVRSSRRRRA